MNLPSEVFSQILSYSNRAELNRNRFTCRFFNTLISRDFSRFPCKVFNELVIKVWTAKEHCSNIDFDLYDDAKNEQEKYPTFVGTKHVRNASKILPLKYVRVRETISIDFVPGNIDGVERSVRDYIDRDLSHLFECVKDVWIGGPEKLSPYLSYQFFNSVRGKHLYIYGLYPENAPLSLYPYGLYNAKSIFVASSRPTECVSIIKFLHAKTDSRLTFNREVTPDFEQDIELIFPELLRLFKESSKEHKYCLTYHICIPEDHYFRKLYKHKRYTHKITGEVLRITCVWFPFELCSSIRGHGMLKVFRDKPCQKSDANPLKIRPSGGYEDELHSPTGPLERAYIKKQRKS